MVPPHPLLPRPPFDPLVWQRTFLQALFGIEYVWELADRHWRVGGRMR